MPRKSDLREVDQVANKFAIKGRSRTAFGKYLEECKQHGEAGTKNDRGDFTRDELIEKAREFLGLPDKD